MELPDFSGYDIQEMTEPAFFANPVGEGEMTGEPVTDAAEAENAPVRAEAAEQ